MAITRIPTDLDVTGTITTSQPFVTNALVPPTAAIQRSKLAQDTVQPFPINLTDLRIHDAIATPLTGTAGTDDLALDGATFATDAPRVTAGDLKAAGATTRYARCLVRLPMEYDDGETANIRIAAGMLTTVADVSCSIDVEAYLLDEDTTIGGDLCATAAQSINSVTFADYDFSLTSASLVSGNILDVRVAITCNDAANVAVTEPAIAAMKLMCDVQG